MSRPIPIALCVAFTAFAVTRLAAANAPAAPIAPPRDRPIIPLWENGAPGSEARRAEPEKVSGNNVFNIHNPTLTVYLPAKETATGCAVIVAPGGGHRNLSIKNEGYDICQWLADHGIAAFLLKYRLARDAATPEGAPQPYTIEGDALADAQRAIRMVRARAAEWHVNPAAVGIIGFSAGGEVTYFAAQKYDAGNPSAPDPLDRPGCKPDFQGLIYPGQSGKIAPTKESPPAFLACGYNDRPDISEGLAKVYLLFKQAGVPAELHIYTGVGHGFGAREIGKSPVGGWLDRFREWLGAQKFLAAAKS
jgi:acetyl esterase/lipase